MTSSWKKYSTLIGQLQSKIVKAPKKANKKKRESVLIKEKCKMTGTGGEITSDDIQIGNTADVHWKKEYHF